MTWRSWIIVVFLVFFDVALLALARSYFSSATEHAGQAIILNDSADFGTRRHPPYGLIEAKESVTIRSEIPKRTFRDVTSRQHFTDCAFRTDANATVGIPASVTLEDGFELEQGDEIAIFTPDSSLCVGATMWTGSNIAVTAWQDDSFTEPVDGLLEGDEMVFVIWDLSAWEEVEVTAVGYERGNGVYTADGVFVVSSFVNQ